MVAKEGTRPRTVFVLVCLCSIVSCSFQATVHLMEDGSPVWNGSCDGTPLCLFNSPCRIDVANPIVNTDASDCILVFHGNWTTPIQWQNDAARLFILFNGDDSAVHGLDLEIIQNTEKSISFSSVNPNLKSAAVNTNVRVIYGNSVPESVVVEHLDFTNSTFQFETGSSITSSLVSSVNITDCSINSVEPGATDFFVAANGTSVSSMLLYNIQNSKIDARLIYIQSPGNIGSFSIVGSTVYAKTLVKTKALASFEARGVSIVALNGGNGLIELDAGLEANCPTSAIFNSASIVSETTFFPSLSNVYFPMNFATATLQGLSFGMTPISGITNAAISGSTFTDCVIYIQNIDLVIDGLTITMEQSLSIFSVLGPSLGTPLQILAREFSINTVTSCPFTLNRLIAFHPLSTLKTTHLTFGEYTNVTFANLEITEGILRSSSSPAEIHAHSDGNAKWTWHSIDIGPQFTAYFDNLQELIYHVGSGNGITTTETSRIPTPPNAVSLVWSMGAPQENHFYNICSLLGYSGSDSDVPFLTNAGDEYIFDVSIESQVLGFRYVGLNEIHPGITMPSDNHSPSGSPCPSSLPVGFECINGIVFAPSDISTTSITLPPSVGIINVNGSVTLTGSLIFDGVGTILNGSGCISVSDGIVIDLSKEENIPDGELKLVIQSDGCSTSLLAIPLRVKTKKDDCRKITAKISSSSTPSALSAVFDINSSGCNVKWIILGSVLGAVVLIAVVVVILIFTFNEKARNCIRPHSKPRITSI